MDGVYCKKKTPQNKLKSAWIWEEEEKVRDHIFNKGKPFS